MNEWYEDGLIDDLRPKLFELRAKGCPLALATIVAADGGPRPIGSQMVIADGRHWGFLSGGCIEEDVALNAKGVLDDGQPRHLIYGHGSPFIDMRLPCGGRIDVLVERIAPDDLAVGELQRLTESRMPARWRSDGTRRDCLPWVDEPSSGGETTGEIRFDPVWRLHVVGDDPFAIAAAALGQQTGFETRLIAPFASETEAPFGLVVDRSGIATALAAEAPDAWTAVIVATHDADLDDEALAGVLKSNAGYIGVMGARRRIADRTQRLRENGFDDCDIDRIHMPLGLPIRARTAWEVAVAAIAEIIDHRRAAT